MSPLDIILLVALVVGAVRGMMTGAVRQLANLLGLLLAFLFAVRLATPLGKVLAAVLAVSDQVGAVLAFILVFIAVEVVLFILARLLEKALGVMKLSFLNRAGGGLAGALKVGLALSVLLVALRFVGVPGAQVRSESMLYEPLVSLLPATWDFVAAQSDDIERFSRKFNPPAR